MDEPDIRTNSTIVEAKVAVSAVREVRASLARLVQWLADSPRKRGYLLLIEPRIGAAKLQEEMRKFKAALRPEIADRLQLVQSAAGQLQRLPADIPPADADLLRRESGADAERPEKLPRPDVRSEVFRVLLHQWIAGQGPLTADWLARTVGCSYRTVAAVVKKLGPAIERSSDRRIRLKYFPHEAWSEFVAVAKTARSTVLYTDRSGQPRSPDFLARKVRLLNRADLAVGGVAGAKRYCPDLDIVGSPRLDLCLHAPGAGVDPLPVDALDPGLERTSDPHRPVQLALHFLRRKSHFFEKDDAGAPWADQLECLLDLQEARLGPQAKQFLGHLESQGGKFSGEGK